MRILNLPTISAAPLHTDPFDFFMAEATLTPGALAEINRDFPPLHKPGLFEIESLEYGPAFAALIEDLRSDKFRTTIESKYGLSLANKPQMITVRSHTQARDGRIHADSTDKLVTCLLYLNEEWDARSGRLRMLRNDHDLQNYVAEVPPQGGTFASFRVTPTSYHGHATFIGPRRSIMVNWLTPVTAATRQKTRHRLSAWLKRHIPGF